MRKFYLLLFSIVLTGISQAQTQLSVFLKQPRGQAQNSTAELLLLPDSSVVSMKVVKTSATFDVQRNTNYLLKITSIGIQPITQPIEIKDSSLSIRIELNTKTGNLGNVTVVSRRPIITQEDDKTIVDAEVLAESSTNALEILEKVPGAIVDQDGNVYLSSATPASIQINGREVKLSPADLASLLKSLPASSVQKIEVLRTPSAKFDASGSGGVVNIVLKKGIKIGTNGTANISYTQGRYHTASSGITINKRNNKVNSFLSYQATSRKNFETLASKRFNRSDNTVIDQNSYTTYPAFNNYLGGGFDIAFSEKLTLGYDARITYNKNKSIANNDNDVYNALTNVFDSRSRSAINNKSTSFYMANELELEYKLDSLGSEWTTSLEYNRFNSDNNQLYNHIYNVKPGYSGDGNIDNKKNILVAETEFVFKTKNKFTIETGAKFINSNSRNNSTYFVDSIGREVDRSQTNKFKYTESISSLYLQVAKTFFGFTVKPGIRMERTDINGRQLFPLDTSLHIKRTDFFPYIYLRHNLFSMMGFTLVGNAIYRRSISRPYYEILNPYPQFVDLYLRDVGNPNLRPQFTTNYEFNIMADDIPVISVGINNTKDIFTNVTYTDDNSKIAYRTYDNLGTSRQKYARILGGIPPGGKYFFYIGVQYNHVHYKGAYQGKPLEYKRGSWLFFMYQNYKPSPTFNISLNGFMRLKALQNFYEIKEFGGLSVSLNKTIMNKKANLILAFNDVFQTNRYNFSIDQPSIKAEGTRYNDTRRAGLTFRYNFGIKPKEENKPGFEQPLEGQ